MLVLLVSSMSESVMTWKGFGRLGSSNTESCAWFSRRFFGGGGASVRHEAFFRGERLLQTLHLMEEGAFIRYEAFI